MTDNNFFNSQNDFSWHLHFQSIKKIIIRVPITRKKISTKFQAVHKDIKQIDRVIEKLVQFNTKSRNLTQDRKGNPQSHIQMLILARKSVITKCYYGK